MGTLERGEGSPRHSKRHSRPISLVGFVGLVVVATLLATSLALAAKGPVRTGRTYKGTVQTDNGSVIYKLFVGPGKTQLEIPITNTSQRDTEFSLSLWNRHGTMVDQANDNNGCDSFWNEIPPGGHSTIRHTVKGPGTFFLKVVPPPQPSGWCGSGAGATYKFTVHSQPRLRSHRYRR